MLSDLNLTADIMFLIFHQKLSSHMEVPSSVCVCIYIYISRERAREGRIG